MQEKTYAELLSERQKIVDELASIDYEIKKREKAIGMHYPVGTVWATGSKIEFTPTGRPTDKITIVPDSPTTTNDLPYRVMILLFAAAVIGCVIYKLCQLVP